MARLRGLRDLLHRAPAGARVVLGDRDKEERHGEADQRRHVELPEREAVAVERGRHGDEPERGEERRDDDALVERVDDRVLAAADLGEERADHRGKHRDATEGERVEPELAQRERRAEQHHGDRGHRVRLEQVGGHARAIADVVADVVRDHRGVARVVLGDPRLDLADEVGSDVGGLGEDAAAEPREDGDQRAAERKPDEVVDRGLGAVPDPPGEDPVVAGDPEQPEADDEQAGDRAGAERDAERRGDSLPGRFCRAHVRANRDVHADEAGRGRERRAEQEADRGPPAQVVVEAEQQERHDRDSGDRRVLLAEVRGRALLHGAGDLPHPLVARRLLEQPPGQVEAVQDRDAGADEREQDGMVNEEIHQSSG